MGRVYVVDQNYINDSDEDGAIVLYLLKTYTTRYCDRYVVRKEEDSLPELKYAPSKIIPIGGNDYVDRWLQKYQHTTLKSLEIPEIFRSNRKFMARDYDIKQGKDIEPRYLNGKEWFVKDITKPKLWNSLLYDGDLSQYINPDHTYAISKRVPIISEWRAFVYKDEVQKCMHYAGDPLCMPTKLIADAVEKYKEDDTRPKAYTIDAAVRELKNNVCQMLIEMHPFVACGLYGFCDPVILEMWEAGYDWCCDAMTQK